MRLKKESEILDINNRKKIIQEIEGGENRTRKDEAYRRYLCFKDQTIRYVVANLLKQFKPETVMQMQYTLSNISFTRKIVDKLARVYNNGVTRTIDEGEGKKENDKSQEDINVIEKELKLNQNLKTTNRYLKLQKLVTLYLKPCPTDDNKWTIIPQVLQPFLFDVIEDYYDRTKAMVHILSHYEPVPDDYSKLNPAIHSNAPVSAGLGDGVDQKIADRPEDEGKGKKTYIFWSKNYHFTCDDQGTIIPDPTNTGNRNPFGISPLITYGIEQDGSFWPQGGNDLVDGSILLNSMITHINHVGIVQGYGQLVVKGENLPRTQDIGPSKAIILEYKKEEQAEPNAEYISANPPLAELRGLIEMYVALLLTSNNLSTSGVATQLQGGSVAPSGIALVIDKAESLEDVQDQRTVFADNEPKVFEVVKAITDTYRDSMIDSLKAINLPKDISKKLTVKFIDATPIVTEKEKLENLKLRQEIGLDSMLDTIMRDDPALTMKQAEEKLSKLLEQLINEEAKKMELRKAAGAPMIDANGDPIPEDPNAPQDPNNPKDPNEGDKNNG